MVADHAQNACRKSARDSSARGNAIDEHRHQRGDGRWRKPMSCGWVEICTRSSGRPRRRSLCAQCQPRAVSLCIIHCSLFRSKGLRRIPTTGPLSWSVPGAVDGWDKLRQKFGTMSWGGQLLTPAMTSRSMAQKSHRHGRSFKKLKPDALLKYPDSEKKLILVRGGQPPNVGDIFKKPQLAASFFIPRSFRRGAMRLQGDASCERSRRVLREERRLF